ncbi:uncharacterized protein [Asterias amurensis]|uniref:uncharacterized protein isoform X1 n=1 Tax=Asterias amurensis TaxID=7602 RepID=UPI003AB6A192
METSNSNHHTPPVTMNSTAHEMESPMEIPYMDDEVPVPSPPSSRSGTLKARKNSKGRSPKCSPLMMNKESSIPIVRREAEKVMDMFLKRRSMSMNDAILQKEFFAQERRKKKDRAPRNNTVSICSTLSTDSSECRNSGDFEEATLQRSKGSFSRALEHSVLPDDIKREQSSADDELSSSDHEMDKEKSRSAPSTLRMQVGPLTEEDREKLRFSGNGYAHHDKEGVKKDHKKRDIPKRRKSLLDKAKQIMRSPSMQRKNEHSEKDKEAPVGPEETSASRSIVHQEMKHTGFANRLKRTFKRDSRKSSLKGNDADTNNALGSSDSKESTKTRRWPSFLSKRKPHKSASTPTDDSLAGATPSDTASNADWASSMSDYDHTKSLTEFDRQKLLSEIHNGVRLRQATTATGSDSQLNTKKSPLAKSPHLPNETIGLGSTGTQTPSSVLSSSQESGLSSDWSSSSGKGGGKQRPRSLNLTRSKRHERAKQGLNDVFKLDRITPGHVRRDTDTRKPVMPTASRHVDNDLETDGVDEDGEISDELRYGQETDEDATLQRPSKREREEFYKRIADRLAQIGDRFVTDYQEGGNGGEPGGPVVSEKVKELAASAAVVEMSTRGGATGSESEERLYEAIGGRITDHVDGYRMNDLIDLELQMLGVVLPSPQSPNISVSMSLLSVVRDHTYTVFRDTMQSLIGQDNGMEQLALVFKFTKLAMKIAQHYGSRATDIKENSLRYIGDRFAAWLDSQGGWSAVVYTSDSEEEDKHDESEID